MICFFHHLLIFTKCFITNIKDLKLILGALSARWEYILERTQIHYATIETHSHHQW